MHNLFENSTILYLYNQVETEGGDKEEPSETLKPPVVVLQTFKKYGDPLALTRTLQALKPRFVVMYDADMTAVRRLEVRMWCQVYQASTSFLKLWM
jgi:hypothetical protein